MPGHWPESNLCSSSRDPFLRGEKLPGFSQSRVSRLHYWHRREAAARRVVAALDKRLGRFGLARHPAKTRLLPCWRPPKSRQKGKVQPRWTVWASRSIGREPTRAIGRGRVRYRDHPLAGGDPRDHALDQVSSGLGYAPPGTRGTKTSAACS
jgi:hypothetical protein